MGAVILGLSGSEGVSSEEPVEETGTVVVEELRVGSSAHAVAPSLSEESPPVSLPFCRCEISTIFTCIDGFYVAAF